MTTLLCDDRRFIPSAVFAWPQRVHFFCWTIVPICVVSGWLVVYPAICLSDVVLLSAMWAITGGLGISVGYHRYYTHNAFSANKSLQILMALCGSMAAQGSLVYWVALHRCHHQHSDGPRDPHSPALAVPVKGLRSRLAAFLHGHIGWVVQHDVPNPAVFARDILKDPIARFFNRTYWGCTLLGVALPGIIVLASDPSFHGLLRGCIWGGLIRILIGNQIIWGVNSLCHTAGHQAFQTRDSSKNNWLLAIPAFGEGWHNNHHAFPWSARFGLRWWQFDSGWWAIRSFALLGMASQIKEPTSADRGLVTFNSGSD